MSNANERLRLSFLLSLIELQKFRIGDQRTFAMHNFLFSQLIFGWWFLSLVMLSSTH